ncbi:unnamed protein product [Clonostachys rosea f. rosea IK726]|uniref:Uncharacterized protein n=3 Tax=Bionectria ochroleuca TaxID=29856 RepID=A0A0B7KIJ4_BIOOC|nr:unnamed protein product [Clonostachys rosea f. rosea IK726]
MPFDPSLPSGEFFQQWINPSDVFSVLLILGGDVVGRALAQVAGTGLTPVTFSFGWVAYAVSAVVSAVGENRLMPLPDCECKVINGKSGYVRDNTSWILGRIMRDYEYWMNDKIRKRVNEMIEEKYQEECQKARDKEPESEPGVTRRSQIGLCVAFYSAKTAEKGAIYLDKVYLSGFFVAVFQLGIAAIPCGLWGDWSILLVTISGILLAFASGSLPQWRKEKWACRTGNPKTVILTRGNGACHAIVISDPDGRGLDLETLAAGQINVDVSTTLSSRIVVGLLAVLWVALLVSASGIKNNIWFLFGIGGIGILQNILVAGWCRKPEAYGLPLHYERVIGMPKVMKALVKVGEEDPGLACSMRETFFPGGMLRDDEKKIWARYEQKAKEADGHEKSTST